MNDSQMETNENDESIIATLTRKSNSEMEAECLATWLNILRSRAISLEASNRLADHENGVVPLNQTALEMHHTGANLVQNRLSHVLTLRKYIDMLHKNVTGNRVFGQDSELNRKILAVTEGISLYTKSILASHIENKKVELMKTKSEYVLVLDAYKNHLAKLKSKKAENKIQADIKILVLCFQPTEDDNLVVEIRT